MPEHRRLIVVLTCLVSVVVRADAAILSGTVSDGEGMPSAGITVLLAPLPDPYQRALELLGRFEPSGVTTLTDAEGSYRFELDEREGGAMPRLLRIELEDGLTMESLLPPLFADTERSLRLPHRSPLRLRVIDERGAPVVGAVVLTRPERTFAGRRPPFSPAAQRVVTDSDGRASLHEPTASQGLYASAPVLVAWAPGHRPIEVERSGAPEETLTLDRAPPRHVIVEQRGQRASGVVALWRGFPLGAPSGPNGRLALPSLVEADDSYRLLQSDLWSIELATPDLTPSSDAEVPPRGIALEPPAVVQGTVRDASTSEPIRGALVAADNGALAETPADGSYRLAAAGLDTYTTFWAHAEGYALAESSRGLDLAAAAGPAIALSRQSRLAVQVLDIDAIAIGGAVVSARSSCPGQGSPASAKGTSDEDGTLTLLGLAGGCDALLIANHPEFASATLAVGAPRIEEEGVPVVVTLEVGSRVRGRIVDDGGSAIAGANVTLAVDLHQALRSAPGMPFRLRDPILPPAAPATTDDSGGFRFEHVASGLLTLNASAAGYSSFVRPRLDVPGGGADVDLGALELERAASLSGRVVDPAGAPVAGARVRATVTREGQVQRRVDSTSSGEDGTFVLDELPEHGIASLVATKEGYLASEAAQADITSSEPLELVLQQGATIRGTVVDASDQPVATTVLALASETRPSGALASYRLPVASLRSTSRSDASGRFELTVAAGRWALRAGNRIGIDEPAPELEVRAGEVREGIVLRSLTPATLRGRILDGEGKPVSGASVSLVIESPTGGGGSRRSSEPSDGGGRFALRGVSPGKATLVIGREGYASASQEITVGDGDTSIEIVLEGGALLEGQVVSTEGGPIPGARVTLASVGGLLVEPAITTTDSNGEFHLMGTPPGLYRPSASAPGFAAASRLGSFVVDERGAPPLRIELSPAITLRGAVGGLAAAQLGGVRIAASSGGAWAATATDPEGAFRLDGLGPGEWVVTATTAADGGSVSELVTISGPEPPFLELTFETGYALYGSVRSVGGSLADARLRLRGWDGAQRETRGDAHGVYRFERLAAGGYALQAEHAEGSTQLALEITGDSYLDVEIDHHGFEGHAVDSGGAPLADVRVVVSFAGATGIPVALATTGADGTFRGELGSGRYRLSASKEGWSSAVLDFEQPRDEPLLVVLEPGRDVIVRGLPGPATFRTAWAESAPGVHHTLRPENLDTGAFRLRGLPSDARFLWLNGLDGWLRVAYRGESEIFVDRSAHGTVVLNGLDDGLSGRSLTILDESGHPWIPPNQQALRPLTVAARELALPAGRWRLVIGSASGSATELPVAVGADTITTVEVPAEVSR